MVVKRNPLHRPIIFRWTWPAATRGRSSWTSTVAGSEAGRERCCQPWLVAHLHYVEGFFAAIRSMYEMSSQTTRFANVKFVFLDRDGVLNRKAAEGEYIARYEEVELLPGAAEAVARVNRSGRKAIVVTNQRGIALGLYTESDLLRIHETLRAQLEAHGAHLDAIYYCPHDHGHCNCRKPGPGLFDQAFLDFKDASAPISVMIGDSLSDVEAGVRMGMRTVLIAEASEGQLLTPASAFAQADACCGSLLEWVERGLGLSAESSRCRKSEE
jgi:D-glycero-D-manno-heptose 1,7-bisphosphate phosphatase